MMLADDSRKIMPAQHSACKTHSLIKIPFCVMIKQGCGKLDPTTSRGRTSLTPNELNIELSCFFLFRFDLESSLERKVISYFYIRSCLIAYSFVQGPSKYILPKYHSKLICCNSKNSMISHFKSSEHVSSAVSFVWGLLPLAQ